MSIHTHETSIGKHRGEHARMHTDEIREVFSSIIGHIGVGSAIANPGSSLSAPADQESIEIYDGMTVEAYFHIDPKVTKKQIETEEISVSTASPDAYEWLYR